MDILLLNFVLDLVGFYFLLTCDIDCRVVLKPPYLGLKTYNPLFIQWIQDYHFILKHVSIVGGLWWCILISFIRYTS